MLRELVQVLVLVPVLVQLPVLAGNVKLDDAGTSGNGMVCVDGN